MPRMNLDTRKQVILLKDQGFTVSQILARLKQEQISITRQALYNPLTKHCKSGCLVDLPKRTRTRKVSDEMVAIIDEALVKQRRIDCKGNSINFSREMA